MVGGPGKGGGLRSEGLEGSPLPPLEWEALLGLFDAQELAGLVGVSPASVRRYASGTRRTPDPVAARLHFLAKVVSDLRGAYDDVGTKRWFSRRRRALDSHFPAQLLSGDWDPTDPDPVRVRRLSRSLVTARAT